MYRISAKIKRTVQLKDSHVSEENSTETLILQQYLHNLDKL